MPSSSASRPPPAPAAAAADGAPDAALSGCVLELYLAGNTPASARAVVNTRRFCEQHLPGAYRLSIVDVAAEPERVRAAQVIAVPTLLKLHPLPVQRFIGDMSRTAVLASRLGLPPADDGAGS